MARSLSKEPCFTAAKDPWPSTCSSVGSRRGCFIGRASRTETVLGTRRAGRPRRPSAETVVFKPAARYPAPSASRRPTASFQQALRTVAVVPAAGRGLRMGGRTPKQFVALGGLPILVHVLRVLEATPSVTAVIVAVPEADRDFCFKEIVSRHGFTKVSMIVAGGEERQDSVRLALAAVETTVDLVLVHDAVRPFVTCDAVERVIAKAAAHGAAIIAVPMRDTVKETGADQMIETTVDRRRLWLAQTPQVFTRALLEDAHRRAKEDGFQGTDDAQLVERLGHRVAIVEGSGDNIKITRPEDLAIGEAILAARSGGR